MNNREHSQSFGSVRPPRITAIIRAAADRYEVTERLVLGLCQEKPCMDARRQVARRLRDEGYSYPVIGRYLNRHHTTIMHLLAHGTEEARVSRSEIPCPDLSGVWAI